MLKVRLVQDHIWILRLVLFPFFRLLIDLLESQDLFNIDVGKTKRILANLTIEERLGEIRSCQLTELVHRAEQGI